MTTTQPLNVDRRVSWNPETKTWNIEPVYGSVRIDIDVEAIIRQLGGKALINKSGKAIEMSGLVKATRVGPVTKGAVERKPKEEDPQVQGLKDQLNAPFKKLL